MKRPRLQKTLFYVDGRLLSELVEMFAQKRGPSLPSELEQPRQEIPIDVGLARHTGHRSSSSASLQCMNDPAQASVVIEALVDKAR